MRKILIPNDHFEEFNNWYQEIKDNSQNISEAKSFAIYSLNGYGWGHHLQNSKQEEAKLNWNTLEWIQDNKLMLTCAILYGYKSDSELPPYDESCWREVE